MLTNRQETPEGQTIARQPLRLVVDEDPPLTDRAALDRWLDRRMHGAFLAMRDSGGRVPSEAIYDIRRNHRRPWRTPAKRIFEAVEAGVPYQAVEEVPVILQQYAHAANIICQRERGRPYRRAAIILLALAFPISSACANTITGSRPAPRAITPPVSPADTAGWILVKPPAVQP